MGVIGIWAWLGLSISAENSLLDRNGHSPNKLVFDIIPNNTNEG